MFGFIRTKLTVNAWNKALGLVLFLENIIIVIVVIINVSTAARQGQFYLLLDLSSLPVMEFVHLLLNDTLWGLFFFNF